MGRFCRQTDRYSLAQRRSARTSSVYQSTASVHTETVLGQEMQPLHGLLHRPAESRVDAYQREHRAASVLLRYWHHAAPAMKGILHSWAVRYQTRRGRPPPKPTRGAYAGRRIGPGISFGAKNGYGGRRGPPRHPAVAAGTASVPWSRAQTRKRSRHQSNGPR